MRLTALDDMARAALRFFFKTSPEQEFVNRTMAEVQSQFEIRGNLTVVDAQGRAK